MVLFRTVGFGAGPGKQTRSCQVQTNKKCFLPYYRNQNLSDCLEHLTFQISKQSLQFSSSNFFLIFSRITFPDILLLCFQKHSYLVSLILDHLQRDRFKIRKFYFLVHNVQFGQQGFPPDHQKNTRNWPRMEVVVFMWMQKIQFTTQVY